MRGDWSSWINVVEVSKRETYPEGRGLEANVVSIPTGKEGSLNAYICGTT